MNSSRSTQFTLFILLLASGVAVGMLLIRAYFDTGWRYFFLLWNLLLAWLPIGFALLAERWHKQWWLGMPATILWLLFFPNAPYLVTDLMHLQWINGAPIWYDALMIFSFALTGLLLGFVSLSWMQRLVQEKWGMVASWLFAIGSLTAGSFGIYIGRFLRWNSWDLFFHPFSLLANLWRTVNHPALGWRMIGISMLFNLILLLTYLLWRGQNNTLVIAGNQA